MSLVITGVALTWTHQPDTEPHCPQKGWAAPSTPLPSLADFHITYDLGKNTLTFSPDLFCDLAKGGRGGQYRRRQNSGDHVTIPLIVQK